MRVNFNVTNQLATPAIHAAALANRPAAGQPGRVFIDTDDPSTGMYRDTGTAWVQIAGTGGGGSLNLQQVTDNGNSTLDNILLNYGDSTQDNALVFYNVNASREEYVVEKRATGITTNDSLVIQSRGNISPSTNPAGIMIDGANDVIKSFYTTAYTELGLKLDFANSNYWIGDYNNVQNGGVFIVNVAAPEIYTKFGNGNIGINISEGYVNIGDFGGIANSTRLVIDSGIGSTDTITTQYGGNDIGLKLDFANSIFSLGDQTTNTYIKADNNIFGPPNNGNVEIYANGYRNLASYGMFTFIGDTAFTGNGTYILINDLGRIISTQGGGLQIDQTNKYYDLGDYAGTNNNTLLRVNDQNQRLEVSNNLKSATAGGSSGQHLKIRIGGTDYKIALLNP